MSPATIFSAVVFLPSYEATPEAQEVIEVVRAAESLYDPLRVEYRSVMTRSPETIADDRRNKERETSPRTLVSKNDSVTVFHREGEREYSLMTSDNDALSEVYANRVELCFDGRQTTLIDSTESEDEESSPLVNFIDSPIPNKWRLTPHGMVFGTARRPWPLADYLSGLELSEQATLVPYPWGMTVERLPDDTFEGEPCVVLRLDFKHEGTDDDEWTTRRDIWLAVEKNHIPVQMKTYTAWASKDLPMSFAVAGEFKEALPGVWYPESATTVVRDRMKYRNSTEVVERYRRTTEVVSLSITTPLPDDICESVETPAGAVVFTVKNDKIVSAEQSLPQPPDGVKSVEGRPAEGGRWLWFVVGAGLAVAGVLLWRRR